MGLMTIHRYVCLSHLYIRHIVCEDVAIESPNNLSMCHYVLALNWGLPFIDGDAEGKTDIGLNGKFMYYTLFFK